MEKGTKRIGNTIGWIFGIFCLVTCLGMPFCFGTFLMFFAGILVLPISPLQAMWEIILSKLPLPGVMKKLKPVVAILLFILAVAIGVSVDNKAENGEQQASLPPPTATVEAVAVQKPSPTTTVKAVLRATEEVDAQTAASEKVETLAPTDMPAPTGTPTPEKTNAVSTVKATTKPTEKSTPKTTTAPTEKATAKPAEQATAKATAKPTEKATPKATAAPTEKATPKATAAPTEAPTEAATEAPQEPMVWVSGTGKKYHSYSGCSNMKSPRQISLSEAKKQGYTPCKNCYH